MSARSNDLSRIQEIYDIIVQTQEQLSSLQFTEERFLDPQDDTDDLLAEGFMNRVFRVTEELGHIEDTVAQKYGFDTRGAKGVRNRLAHVYGEVDKQIVWKVLAEEFDEIEAACRQYGADLGINIASADEEADESAES